MTRALSKRGIHPVLVGGAAVEVYTGGAYRTGDLDFVAPRHQELVEELSELGFEAHGRHLIHPELELWLEFPGSSLEAGEAAREIDVEGDRISVVSPEDLVMDRLRGFRHWRSTVDGLNAVLLLAIEEVDVDQERLDEISGREPELREDLEALRKLAAELADDPSSAETLEARLEELLGAP